MINKVDGKIDPGRVTDGQRLRKNTLTKEPDSRSQQVIADCVSSRGGGKGFRAVDLSYAERLSRSWAMTRITLV